MKKIPLSKGMEVIVDDDKYKMLSQWKWYAKKGSYNHYAARSEKENGQGKTIYMHRFLTNCPEGMTVDHLDGCTFNNRIANLEVVSKDENSRRRNTKIYGQEYIPF